MPRAVRSLFISLATVWIVLSALPAAGQSRPVTVFAAASLGPILEALTKVARTRGTGKHDDAVSIVPGSSGTLARQIERGAPADLFLSANRRWIDYLGDRISARTVGEPVVFASNRMALIAKSGAVVAPVSFDLTDISRYRALLGPRGRITLGDPAHVPAGQYAMQVLESLGLWNALSERLAPARNVRAALALVDRGVAPLGIVYASDAAQGRNVRLLGVYPSAHHSRIAYLALSLSDAPAVGRFIALLQSDTGAKVLSEFGFLPADRD